MNSNHHVDLRLLSRIAALLASEILGSDLGGWAEATGEACSGSPYVPWVLTPDMPVPTEPHSK